MTDLNLASYDLADYQEIYDLAERYAREELYPLQEKMDNEEWWPDEAFRRIAEAGLLGVTVPGEYGGAGMDLIAQTLIAQAMSKWNHQIALSWGASDNLCVNNIVRNANDEQRARYLPRFCDGSAIGALGLTEPGAGSDAMGSMRTTARREGDHYILNGSKMFITNGPVADVLLVYAKTAPELGPKGISAFIVEKDFAGFSVAQKLIKMGWRGSPTGELVFEDCRVPAANLVGGENSGVSIVMSGLNLERVLVCGCAIGMAERALELSVEYAKERKQFNQPIANFQMIQSMLADMYTDLETTKAQTYQLLKETNHLEKGGGGRGEIHKRSAACLLHAGRAYMRIVDQAVQIHGGMGYMWETEINRLYRAGKLLEIGAGTNEVRKMIIADELLRD